MSYQFFIKDKNLVPENIRKGVRILKVIGTLEGGSVVNNQDKTVYPSSSLQYVTADQGYDGIGLFTLMPYTTENVTVDSSTSAVVVTPTSADCLWQVIVNPYTLQSKTVSPSATSQTVTPDQGYNGLSSVTVNAVTAAVDPDIIPGNIKNGVNVLGVTGTYGTIGDWVADVRSANLGDMSDKTLVSNSGQYAYSYLLANLNNGVPRKKFPQFSGTTTSNYEFYCCFKGCQYISPKENNRLVIPFQSIGRVGMAGFLEGAHVNSQIEISFPNLTNIDLYALNGFISGMSTTGYVTVSMPMLTSIPQSGMFDFAKNVSFINLPDFIPNITSIGVEGMKYSFYNTNSANYMAGAVNFNSLASISSSGLAYAFYNRARLTSCSFPLLTSLSTSSMENAFYNCTGLTSISFPALTSTTSWSFQYTFCNCENITSVSFPELTTISGTDSTRGMFAGCPSLTTFSASKLSVYTTNNSTDNMFGNNNTTLTTVTLHPGCLKSSTNSPIYGCSGITSVTFSEDATDDVYLIWQPNLSASSVMNVLTHLDASTSGKSCNFYTNGITFLDDQQGTMQAAYDAAVQAGWTINNLIVESPNVVILHPQSGASLDPTGSDNYIEFDSLYYWTAVASSQDVTLSQNSGQAGTGITITVTVQSGWEGDETVTITSGGVSKTVRVYKTSVVYLDYIESAGQYVDLGFEIGSNYMFEAEYTPAHVGDGGFVYNKTGLGSSCEFLSFFGSFREFAMDIADTSGYERLVCTRAQGGGCDPGTKYVTQFGISSDNVHFIKGVDWTGGVTANGEPYNNRHTGFGSARVFSTNDYGKLHRLKVYDSVPYSAVPGLSGYTPIYDFRPALYNGEYGLYETVNRTWHTNTGITGGSN